MVLMNGISKIIESATLAFHKRATFKLKWLMLPKLAGVAPGNSLSLCEKQGSPFRLGSCATVLNKRSKIFPPSSQSQILLPVPTLDYLEKAFSENAKWPNLKSHCALQLQKMYCRKLRLFCLNSFELLKRNRWALLVISRSAVDFPGLTGFVSFRTSARGC